VADEESITRVRFSGAAKVQGRIASAISVASDPELTISDSEKMQP
jgi:hypothetical protein